MTIIEMLLFSKFHLIDVKSFYIYYVLILFICSFLSPKDFNKKEIMASWAVQLPYRIWMTFD